MALTQAQYLVAPGGPGVIGAVKAGSNINIAADGSISLSVGGSVNQVLFKDSNGSVTGSSNLTFSGSTLQVNGAVNDSWGYVRTIPQNAQSAFYELTASDSGRHVSVSSTGVAVPPGVFSAGDAVSVYNNSSLNQVIFTGSGVTMYLAGTSNTGNRTLAQRGLCTILCVGANTFVISGAGVT